MTAISFDIHRKYISLPDLQQEQRVFGNPHPLGEAGTDAPASRAESRQQSGLASSLATEYAERRGADELKKNPTFKPGAA
jgi:hypothetical protein